VHGEQRVKAVRYKSMATGILTCSAELWTWHRNNKDKTMAILTLQCSAEVWNSQRSNKDKTVVTITLSCSAEVWTFGRETTKNRNFRVEISQKCGWSGI
jgi:hypothetical protein